MASEGKRKFYKNQLVGQRSMACVADGQVYLSLSPLWCTWQNSVGWQSILVVSLMLLDDVHERLWSKEKGDLREFVCSPMSQG